MLDSPDKLHYPDVPPHGSFYSSLKQANITDEEYAFAEVGKAQLPQPPELRKLRCALIFYFETLRKLRCEIKPLKFVVL